MNESKHIAVIGAGMMGQAIAQVFATAGHEVSVFNHHPAKLQTLHARIRQSLRDMAEDETVIERVHACNVLSTAVANADFVVETVAEDLQIKRELFRDIEAFVRPNTVLASNTSVIPITQIMQGLIHPERALGTHWWNPAHLIPLVEVIGTEWTTPECISWTMALHKSAGKTPVHARKDVPGFIANRLQHALWREAIALVQNGICDAETVDICVKSSFGRRLAVLGPLENADLVGTDLTTAIHQTVLADLDQSTGPQPYLLDLVASGHLGMKTGQGFRSWTPEQQAALKARLVEHLKHSLENDHDVD